MPPSQTVEYRGGREVKKFLQGKKYDNANIATTSFALETGLAFVDGGAISGRVVGAANAMASLSLQLELPVDGVQSYQGHEWRASSAGNIKDVFS
jgi:hypothetical protein